MQKEKVRVYALARELNMESKDLLDLCRQAGIDVKNQLSSLDPEQRDAVELMVRGGGGGVAVAAPPKSAGSATAVIPSSISTKVPVLPTRTPRRETEPVRPAVSPPITSKPPETAPAAATAPPTPPAMQPAPLAARIAEPEQPQAAPPATPEPATPSRTTVSPGAPATGRVPELVSRVPTLTSAKVPDLGQARTDTPGRRRPRDIPRPVVRVASVPPLKQRPAKEEKPKEPVAQKPISRPPAEVLRGGNVPPPDVVNKGMLTEAPTPTELEDEEERKGKLRPGQVTGRDKRHEQRNARAKLRKDRLETDVQGGRVLLPVDEERPQSTRGKLKRIKQRQLTPTLPRKSGKVPVEAPITVRSLSEAIGVRSQDILKRLLNLGTMVTINSSLEPEVAETVALELGNEIEVKRSASSEETLLAGLDKPDEPETLVPRAPIVTIMGHVDHGKTSLLDKIRQTNVVATEAGGITQVIRAWRVNHQGRPVTFLDTPGHEAFTKMRARGAHVTDIAVIVVAADDGVMPQTEEAINHAKAAEVPFVVAINKVDLPNANVNRTRERLYNLGLMPDNMGGDIPFVETSAATGQGIDQLLQAILDVADVLLEDQVKANPSKPGQGTCLEAMLSEGEGVLATLLVQEGTLHRGDVILCGASYGRVRAMYDDLGRPIQEAGPSVPVRITGLDEVPNADDPFVVVPDLATAREIAGKRKMKQLEAQQIKREPVRLEKLNEIKIAELKVILKADFRGSIEAIRKELEKLYHEEVRVRLLHAAIGGITESDVQLALTSPEDTIIVGFNVVPDERARALAEERGVQIRQYDIIYNLTNDIRAALEGKLKPREEVIFLGRANVREVFKISRVGTVAGCYVTQGVIERSAKVRVIREGVVIYPPSDRTASLESLKRFREDVREVREGFECGLKIAGYDDIKVGDAIEAYRVEQIQRTL